MKSTTNKKENHLDKSIHQQEQDCNLIQWSKRPLLRRVYKDFYHLIREHLFHTESDFPIVELGSGIAKITDVIPDCITTDFTINQWVDQHENAYSLSFSDNSISNLILFDTFHHLRYPGSALLEFQRVLIPQGRIILFEPCFSLLGLLVYGLFHKEDLGLLKKITLFAPKEWDHNSDDYYAAQANCYRLFKKTGVIADFPYLKVVYLKKFSAFPYLASGGYTGPAMLSDKYYSALNALSSYADILPYLFATRMLVTIEK